MPSRPSPFRTWLQLFRVPNLCTVPGDPLAGYFLASFAALEGTLWNAVGASLCFYASGLLLNDLADLREDRAERPARPLPSGAARPATVGAVMLLLAALGLWLCARVQPVMLQTGLALVASIATYNLFTKRLAVFGAVNMGLCRGLSLLLGATAVPHGELTYRLIVYRRLDHVVLAAGLLTLYIAAVTHLARFETRVVVPRPAKWLPPLVLAAGAIPFVLQLTATARYASSALFALAFLFAWQCAAFLEAHPATPLPPQIGQLIRLLLLIQAAFCAAIGGVEGSAAAALLVLLWPCSRALGRRFYAS